MPFFKKLGGEFSNTCPDQTELRISFDSHLQGIFDCAKREFVSRE